MVICPIARAVHCTGCPFFKFCPVKTILGDYGKDDDKSAKKAADQVKQRTEEKSADSSGRLQ
jgi:hypothetical protein